MKRLFALFTVFALLTGCKSEPVRLDDHYRKASLTLPIEVDDPYYGGSYFFNSDLALSEIAAELEKSNCKTELHGETLFIDTGTDPRGCFTLSEKEGRYALDTCTLYYHFESGMWLAYLAPTHLIADDMTTESDFNEIADFYQAFADNDCEINEPEQSITLSFTNHPRIKLNLKIEGKIIKVTSIIEK